MPWGTVVVAPPAHRMKVSGHSNASFIFAPQRMWISGTTEPCEVCVPSTICSAPHALQRHGGDPPAQNVGVAAWQQAAATHAIISS